MQPEVLTVLLISSQQGAAEVICTALDSTRFRLERAETLAAGFARLPGGAISAAIVDRTLLDEPAPGALQRVQAQAAPVPVVLLVQNESDLNPWLEQTTPPPDYLALSQITAPRLAHTLYTALERSRYQAALDQTTRDLQASKTLFRNTIDKNADGIVIIDKAGVIRFVNATAEKLFDRPAESLVGALFGFPVMAGESTELDILQPGGETVVVEMQVVQAEWEGQPAWLASLRDITGRKQSEAELRQERDFAESLVETAQVIVLVLDEQARIVRFNSYMEDLSGYTLAEVQGKDWFSTFLPSREHGRIQEVFERASSGIQTWGNINPIMTKDGRERLIEWYDRVLKGPNDTVIGILAIGLDITERKRAEEAEARQRAMTEALADITAALLTSTLDIDAILKQLLSDIKPVIPYAAASILLVDADDIVTIAHHTGYDQFGLEEWVGRTRLPIQEVPIWHRIFLTGQPWVVPDTSDSPEWVKFAETSWIGSYVGAAIRQENRVIGILNLYNLSPLFYNPAHASQLQAFADQAGVAIQNARLYEAVRRHAAEMEQRVEARTSELAQERAQLQAILDAMGEGVLYVDHSSRVQYANGAFCHLTGYTMEDIQQTPLPPFTFYQAADPQATAALHESITQTMEKDHLWRGETKIRRKDGSQFDAGITITAVTGPDGLPIGRVELIRDISHQKALQSQKDRFIANASHELRTPLTNIKMRLYLMRRQPLEMGEHLRMLTQITNHMESLVNDLLDTSRFERGVITIQRGRIVLQDLLRDAVMAQQPHAQSKDLALSVEMPSAPLRMWVDPQRLTQVFTNLIANAINYTLPGGTIGVRISVEDDGPGKNAAVIHVQDSGIGIAPDQLDHIFEPFFRASDSTVEGTGLGLTITKEIVDLHGGELTVESKPGQGSIFRVKLALLDQ